MRGYTTHGSVRGGCGHLHKTTSAAEQCVAQDHSGCASRGGYSDRSVFVVGDDNYLYRDENCSDWLPADGGRSNGAARFRR